VGLAVSQCARSAARAGSGTPWSAPFSRHIYFIYVCTLDVLLYICNLEVLIRICTVDVLLYIYTVDVLVYIFTMYSYMVVAKNPDF